MRSGWFGIITAGESALVLLLLLIASWQFWEWASPAGQLDAPADSLAGRMPSFGTSQMMIAVLVAAGVYGLIQFFGRGLLALWVAAFLTILPQLPGIWGHNKLGWEKFMGVETAVGEGHTLFVAGGLFVASLLGLFVLHRLIALRKLGGLLTARHVNDTERDGTLAGEGATLTAIVAVALLLALFLMVAGTGIGRTEWVTAKVPWTVVTIGGGACALLIGFIVLFLRGLSAENVAESNPGD